MLNSRLGLFVATLRRSPGKPDHEGGHLLSRSYEVNLPSSLTWLLSRTLGFSPYLPVSVCGTDSLHSTLRRFSWRQSIGCSAVSEDPAACHASDLMPGGFASRTSCALRPSLPNYGQPSFPRPSIAPVGKYRNINLLSIGYALRPGLRLRLTLGGRTCPRNPEIFGGRDSHPPSRYSCLHGHLSKVHQSFQPGFGPWTTLSYRSAFAGPWFRLWT